MAEKLPSETLSIVAESPGSTLIGSIRSYLGSGPGWGLSWPVDIPESGEGFEKTDEDLFLLDPGPSFLINAGIKSRN